MSRPGRKTKENWLRDDEGFWATSRPEDPRKTLFKPSKVRAKTANQQEYIDAIDRNTIIFAIGPSGSGKSHLAVAKAVEAFQREEAERLVFIRPCLGVGRTSGYLPGDLEAKVSHYLRPILDELGHFYTPEQVRKLIDSRAFELTSLEYCRGRNFRDSVVILDEAQNATQDELWTFLTRLAEGTKYIITGDLSRNADGRLTQCDLPPHEQGALERFAGRFADLAGIAAVRLTQVDIVRHPLVRAMVERGQ